MNTSGSSPSVVSSASPSPSEPAPPSTSTPSSEFKIERYTILSTPDGDDLYYLWEHSDDLCDGAHWKEVHKDYLPETKTFWLTAIINPKDTSFFERLIYTDPSIKNWFPLAKLEEAGGSLSENAGRSLGAIVRSRRPWEPRLVPCVWPPPGRTFGPRTSIWPSFPPPASDHLVSPPLTSLVDTEDQPLVAAVLEAFEDHRAAVEAVQAAELQLDRAKEKEEAAKKRIKQIKDDSAARLQQQFEKSSRERAVRLRLREAANEADGQAQEAERQAQEVGSGGGWKASTSSTATSSTAVTESVLATGSAAETVPMAIMSDEEYRELEEQCRAESMKGKSDFPSLVEYWVHRVKLNELMAHRIKAMEARHKAWDEMDYSSS